MKVYTVFTPGPIRRIEAATLAEAKTKAEVGFGVAMGRRGYTHGWTAGANGTHTFQVLDTKGRVSTGCVLVLGDRRPGQKGN